MRTLNRAKVELRVKSLQAHFRNHSAWYWYDQTASWPANAPFPQPYEHRLPELDPLPSTATPMLRSACGTDDARIRP